MFSNKKVVAIIFVFCMVIANVGVYASSIKTQWPTAGTGVNKVTTVAKNVWANISLVVQVLAVATVVFAGLRYMFSSADGRADIKKEMAYLALGAILVFCTATVIRLITSSANELIN